MTRHGLFYASVPLRNYGYSLTHPLCQKIAFDFT